METERVELEDGQWWEIRTSMTVGMQRASDEITRHALVYTLSEGNGKQSDDTPQGILKLMPKEVKLDWDKVNLTEISRVLVFHATVAWSYGEVTNSVYETIDIKHYLKVKARVDELCGSLPLAGS